MVYSDQAAGLRRPHHPVRRSDIVAVLGRYLQFTIGYWREATSFGDFLRLMQVRLSQSKLGKLVCPRPLIAKIRVRSLGARPISVRSHTTDISVLGEVIVYGGYDSLLRHRLGDMRYIVDLGANTGFVDRWLLEHFPGAAIVAVEPEPGNVRALRENVRGLAVAVAEVAVGATARTATLHTSSGEHGFTLLGEPETGSPAFEVPVVPLDEVVDESRPIDLLKVDIEGAEEELFADCSGWIDRVRTLLIECHGRYKLANLIEDLRRGGAEFDLLETDAKPEWGFEVGLLVRRAAA